MIRLSAFIGGVAAALGLFYAAPALLKDNPAKGSYWIAKVLTYQDDLLEKEADRPRLSVPAGSNGLYGFDGRYLEKYSGYDVVNLSTHVGFDLRFHEQRLRGKLRPDDVVVAPLEHLLYRRTSETDFHQEQNLLWLQRFFTYETPLERLTDNLKTRSEIYARLAFEKLTGERRDLTGLAEPGNDGVSAPAVMTERLPLHVSLADRDGFFVIPLGSDDSVKADFGGDKRPYTALPVSALDDAKVMDQLLSLRKTVENQGARLLVTWPAMADIVSHSSHDPVLLDDYRAFEAELNRRGVPFVCDPAKMFIAPELFHDTVYHVNAWGALERSIRLAQCLRGEGLGFSAEVAGHTMRNQLGIRFEREKLRAPFEVAMQEIEELEGGLKQYRAEHGAYPKSSNNGRDWDGFISRWGNSTANWINGLAPQYVSALPRDWRRSKRADYQYLYRSNGSVYKIMNRRPPDCELARTIVPEFIDPSRDCWAYAASTGLARTW